MVTPRATVGAFTTDVSGLKATLSERTSRSGRQPRCASPLSRQYEVAALTPSGELVEQSLPAPATPLFEDAFAVFARGTLIATEHGQTAIEDLMPGDLVQTSRRGLRPVLWIGSTKLAPKAVESDDGDGFRLTRMASDAFGLGRPVPDLVLGPRARILHRSARCLEMLGSTEAFAPAHAFSDGVNVIEVRPLAPVRLYQIAFHGQQSILANGIEIETYHPGPQFEALVDRESREHFLRLFPHVTGFDDFGQMQIPRLTAFELDALRNG